MKRFLLHALEYRGEYICQEEPQENGEVFLLGYFKSDPQKRQSLYILNTHDKELN